MKKILFLIILIVVAGVGYLFYTGKLSKEDLKNPNKVKSVVVNEIKNKKELINKKIDEIKEKANDLKQKAQELQKKVDNINK